MADCERCGGRATQRWARDEGGTARVVHLCGTCDAEILEWLEQDGVYTPLFREAE